MAEGTRLPVYVPRNRWLQTRIHSTYSVYSIRPYIVSVSSVSQNVSVRRQLEGVNRCLMHFQHWPPEGSLYILSAYPVQGTFGGEFVTTPRFPIGTIKQRDTPYRPHALVDRTEGHALQVPCTCGPHGGTHLTGPTHFVDCTMLPLPTPVSL